VFLSKPEVTREVNSQLPMTNFQLPSLMTTSSSAFKHNEFIPRRYTCDGDDINPPLTISGVPANAKSVALLVDDPDAPRGTLRPGSGQAWVHWTVWNIDPKTASIPENGLPPGVNLGDVILGPQEGTTDFGRPGYGGPCPPSGTHRYLFKIYALDEALPDLDSRARKADLEAAMQGHILDRAELIGLYKRS